MYCKGHSLSDDLLESNVLVNVSICTNISILKNLQFTTFSIHVVGSNLLLSLYMQLLT